jgi:hypothetical protein
MMNMKKYITRFAFLFLSIFILAGCTDQFEEINTDPDRAKDAPATNVLAFVLTYWPDNLNDVWADMNEPSTYAGHLAKIQYIDEAKYNFRPGVVESKWYDVYLTLNNVNEIIVKAEADDNQNLLAVARILRAYIFQTATDTWRDIPYTDAMKISEGTLLPQYDKQEDIYPALLQELKEAADIFATNSTGSLGDGDILFDGDTEKWQKFANSLRLRLSMRISAVNEGLASSTVSEILGNPGSYPVMESNDDNAFFWWPGSDPYEEPWYTDYKGRDDHAVSDVLVNVMLELDDPRLPVYAIPAESDSLFRGFTIGAAAQPNLTTVSRIGERFRLDPAGFTPYMRYAEVMFHIAEAALKGFNTGGITAEDAYNAAVEASLLENEISTTDISAYLSGGGLFDSTLDQIYLQEWIALFKQGMEAWSLYRRTGIPATHYVAPASIYPGHNSPPFRYPYPQNELTLNGVNSTPFENEVTDAFWGKKMWWDTRQGVN